MTAIGANIKFTNGQVIITGKMSPEVLNIMYAHDHAEQNPPEPRTNVLNLSAPGKLWAVNRYVVVLLNVQPVLVKLKPGAVPPCLPQYPLNVSQIAGIQEQLSRYEQVFQCMSVPC